MTKVSKKIEQYRRIEEHGRQLLALYPNATERDPVKLCKKLRWIELQAEKIGLGLCNDERYSSEQAEIDEGRIFASLAKVLGNGGPEIFINLDPRGYALKIDSDLMNLGGYQLHRDWGGYGIIAPEING